MAAHAHPARRLEPLTDRFGRVHTYLRVSVTDRCNFRCVYCLPAEGLSWKPRNSLLTYEEIARLVGIFARMGVRKIRLTGGEPTIRSDIEALVAGVAAVPGIREVAMTTNAHALARVAPRLAAAGLQRVNVSIDTLDPEGFRRITRGGRLEKVLAGIEACLAAGIAPVKLNAVLLRGDNEDQLFPLVEYAAARAPAVSLRFIEYMPFEARWHQSVRSRELRERLSARYTLRPVHARATTAGPSRVWTIAENGLEVGFISPLSEHFCATCNRLRLSCEGDLRTCLAHEDNPSLRDLLRDGASDDELAATIRSIVMGKPEGHQAELDGGVPFEGVMTTIGG